MSDVKWIKVVVDMFEDSKIDFIRSLPEGDAILVTWIQMLAIAGQSNMSGYLMVAEGIPYTEQLLSTKLRRSPTIMQFTLEMLSKLKMINVEDGPYHITNWEKHQNVDGLEKIKSNTAKRVAKHREKQKEKARLLQCNVTKALHVTHCNATEIELELDIKHKHKQEPPISKKEYADDVFLSETEYGKLIEKYGETLTMKSIEILSTYKGSNGKKYKSDYKAMLNWVFNEAVKRSTPIISTNRTSMPNQQKEFVPDPELLKRIKEANGHV